MQVGNNYSSPNFGMALRIKNPQETAKALKELPMDVVESYQKAGEALKGTKFYHVEVGPDLKPQMVSEKGAYWGPHSEDGLLKIAKMSPDSDNLRIGTSYGVSRLYGGDVAEDGMVHHNIWANWGTVDDGKNVFTLPSMAEVATKLDKAAVEFSNKEAAKIAAEKAAKAKVAQEVKDLICKFGV